MHHTIQVKDKTIETLEDGYMLNRELWDEDVAQSLAEHEGIALTEEHWEVIHYLREYYEDHLITPNIKILIKHMKETMGEENVDKKRLYTLFPNGPAYQGCKIAGLPKPKSCIDG